MEQSLGITGLWKLQKGAILTNVLKSGSSRTLSVILELQVTLGPKVPLGVYLHPSLFRFSLSYSQTS